MLPFGQADNAVKRGGDCDAALEAVIDDLPAVGVGEPTCFDERRDATASGVGLDPVEAAVGDEALEIFETGLSLTRRDRDGTLCREVAVAFDIVRMQWFLDPERTVGQELSSAFLCRFPVPNLTGVESRMSTSLPCSFSSLLHEGDVVRFVLPHWTPAKFDGRETEVHVQGGEFASFVGRVTE